MEICILKIKRSTMK